MSIRSSPVCCCWSANGRLIGRRWCWFASQSAFRSQALLQRDAAIGVWEIDPGTSVLEFRVKHFWGAVTVRGRFGTVTGRLDVAASGIVSGTVEAEVASLDTGNATRDKHLRSAAFFDAAKIGRASGR